MNAFHWCNHASSFSLLGNHDAASIGILSSVHFNIHARIAVEWTAETLSPQSKAYLHSLALTQQRDMFFVVHATPYMPDQWLYISDLAEAAFNFQYFDTRYCFTGHTHVPMVLSSNGSGTANVHRISQVAFQTFPERRFLINVGSVGQPRDRNPDACYGILDSEVPSFTYRRIRYPVFRTQEKMRKAHIPEFLISRLGEGR